MHSKCLTQAFLEQTRERQTEPKLFFLFSDRPPGVCPQVPGVSLRGHKPPPGPQQEVRHRGPHSGQPHPLRRQAAHRGVQDTQEVSQRS